MNAYLTLYNQALSNYIQQVDRTHFSILERGNLLHYGFGLFSKLRHSAKEYPELSKLKAELEKDTSKDQESALIAIKAHFSNEKNKWNNHSFNNYLLDEIRKNTSEEIWMEHWQCFDKKPIVYYQGILFRGIGDKHEKAFNHGLLEKGGSSSLEDYIQDMNGAIGVSTSKSFAVAKGYALPTIIFKNEVKDVWSESYIYVINYRGQVGIDLTKTFSKRDKNYAASLSEIKQEVNVIKQIPPEDIFGAFYVNRSGKIVWHQNPNYQLQKNETTLIQLQDKLPQEFLNELQPRTQPKMAVKIF